MDLNLLWKLTLQCSHTECALSPHLLFSISVKHCKCLHSDHTESTYFLHGGKKIFGVTSYITATPKGEVQIEATEFKCLVCG